MPADLRSETPEPIQVRDNDGVDLPFSRGIMATSILATGVETDRAYGIAETIQRTLLTSGCSELDTDSLADLAAAKIAESAGDAAAARYVAWRHVRHANRPIVVCLAGAPGVGKSTLATRLALRLGVNRVVPSDAIREVLRTVIPDTVLPELHVSTYEAPDGTDGGSPRSGFVRQARAVTNASAAVASRLSAEGRHVILEGVHLLPGDVSARLRELESEALVVEVLLTLSDACAHQLHLRRRARTEPHRDGSRHLRNFPVIRQLQDELQRRAALAGVPEFDISRPEQLTQHIVDRIVDQFEITPCIAHTGT